MGSWLLSLFFLLFLLLAAGVSSWEVPPELRVTHLGSAASAQVELQVQHSMGAGELLGAGWIPGGTTVGTGMSQRMAHVGDCVPCACPGAPASCEVAQGSPGGWQRGTMPKEGWKVRGGLAPEGKGNPQGGLEQQPLKMGSHRSVGGCASSAPCSGTGYVPTIPTHPWGKQTLDPALLLPGDSCVPTLSPAVGRREGQAAAPEPWEIYLFHGRTEI